ncbi:MAG: hypothetical protein IT532_14145 [Burkholderiales bacterium]|nr:hypothetical protein [Burkholderiales bacterium]
MISRTRLWEGFANQLASVGHVGLLGVGLHLKSAEAWLAVLGAIALTSAALWAANFRRARAVSDTPTSRIGSAHQGYVELVGKARPFGEAPLLSPHSRTPCVWYRFRVEERRDNKWYTRGAGRSDASFRLEDGSGTVLIDPERAEVVTDHMRRWVERDMRYTEWLLIMNARVYALGEFATIGGGNADLDHRADVGHLLDGWKREPAALRARFDLDEDGEVSLKEWALARRAAQREVSSRHAGIRSQPGTHVLRAPRDGRMFVLSNLDPGLLARRYRSWTAIQLGIAIVAASGCLILLFRTPLA